MSVVTCLTAQTGGSARGYEQHHAPLTTRAKAEQAAARSYVYASSALCVLARSCRDVV
jgi:hypothetical protein